MVTWSFLVIRVLAVCFVWGALYRFWYRDPGDRFTYSWSMNGYHCHSTPAAEQAAKLANAQASENATWSMIIAALLPLFLFIGIYFISPMLLGLFDPWMERFWPKERKNVAALAPVNGFTRAVVFLARLLGVTSATVVSGAILGVALLVVQVPLLWLWGCLAGLLLAVPGLDYFSLWQPAVASAIVLNLGLTLLGVVLNISRSYSREFKGVRMRGISVEV